MARIQRLPRNVAAVLTFSRPPLVFGAFASALWVMFTENPLAYLLGVSLLVLAMAFDWIDGWFADRYIPDSRLGPLADRMMDRIVLSIIFPVLGAGMFWRYHRLDTLDPSPASRLELLHTLFVLAICVLVLMRDQFANFLRNFALRQGETIESFELTRLRAIVASPMAVLLYAYAFYLPAGRWQWLTWGLSWLDQLPLRAWFVLEIVFLVISVASITPYIRKYGSLALDDICEDNELLRRRILSVFPNALTLMNAALGVTAMVFASSGRVKEALFIIVGAAFFDRLDGSLARRLGLTEPLPDQPYPLGVSLGAVLDDLSDLVSFVIAPAVIFYMVTSGFARPYVSETVAIAYFLGGAARLTYFILDDSPVPGFFKGMPVPGAALLVMAPVEIVDWSLRAAPGYTGSLVLFSSFVTLLAVLVMNLYPVRYLHFGRLLGRHPAVLYLVLPLWLLGVFTPYYGWLGLAGAAAYLVSPLFTRRIDPSTAEIERRPPGPR